MTQETRGRPLTLGPVMPGSLYEDRGYRGRDSVLEEGRAAVRLVLENTLPQEGLLRRQPPHVARDELRLCGADLPGPAVHRRAHRVLKALDRGDYDAAQAETADINRAAHRGLYAVRKLTREAR